MGKEEKIADWKATLAGRKRGRGRPRTASEELRQNNYRDEDGKYVMTSGLKHWHERIVDWMILNPNANVAKVAQEFDVSRNWAGMVMATDAFREYYALRLREHQNLASAVVVAKMQGVAIKAMDKAAEKLDQGDVTISALTEMMGVASKALGMGAGPGGLRVNVNTGGQGDKVFIGVSKDTMDAARAQLAEARKRNSRELEDHREDFQRVTASMEIQPENIEDAVVIDDGKMEKH